MKLQAVLVVIVPVLLTTWMVGELMFAVVYLKYRHDPREGPYNSEAIGLSAELFRQVAIFLWCVSMICGWIGMIHSVISTLPEEFSYPWYEDSKFIFLGLLGIVIWVIVFVGSGMLLWIGRGCLGMWLGQKVVRLARRITELE